MARRDGLVAAALAAACLTACSSAVGGHGTGSGGSTGSTVTFPSNPAVPTASAGSGGGLETGTTTTSTPTPTTSAPPSQDVTVTGSSTGHSYDVGVRAVDHIADCAEHAYGAPLVSFLHKHNCRSATRRLVTLDLDGTAVALSIITVTMPADNSGDGSKIFDFAGRLVTLENADGTGSMNDLLREGVRIPGLQTAIPSAEAFQVISQDLVVCIFDAWFVHSVTPQQDRQLLALERDLFLTPVSSDP